MLRSLLLAVALGAPLFLGPLAAAGPQFVRGDGNADGSIDLSDAIHSLFWLFGATSELPCRDAADADDNGQIEISDVIRVLGYLFLDGAAPGSPFPGCGPDPSTDQLDCGSFPPCQVNAPPRAVFSASLRTGIIPLTVEFDASASSDPDGQVVGHLWDFGDGAIAAGAHSSHRYDSSGTYIVTLTVMDDQGATGSSTLGINPRDPGVPPDPTDVAPPLDGTSIPSFADAVGFLYSAADAVQSGVAPDAIVAARAAVLRGRVTTLDGNPLPSVTVNVLAHPELGSTVTRPDGMFDLAVNGGGALVLRYERADYLPAQRQVDVPWQDYRWLPDVALIPLDPGATAIDPSASLQVARGSPVADGDGSRQATLLFPQGTTAEMVLPDGSHQPLATLTVRATEYTVGGKGPQAMPADLPPTSGYTYCAEFTVDEALAAGATEVRFSAPLPFYVENFLGFPVGTDVPYGTYDRTRGLWIPGESGKVIAIVGVTAGAADLDLDGDGVADGAAALAALSITAAERVRLAALYAPGQSLWRVRVAHFSPGDCNWPMKPPDDAAPPNDDPEPDDPLDNSCSLTGNSVIEAQNQILGESVGVAGTPYRLHYQSDRVPGRRAGYSVEIPLSGAQLPASVIRIDLEIQVAGRLFREVFGPGPDQRTTFTWDGLDAYGRKLQGAQPIKARIGNVYRAVYGKTSKFGSPAEGVISTVRSRQEVALWRTWQGRIGTWSALVAGLGGWTLSAHHAYDPFDLVLYRGDGKRQHARAIGPIISTFAGTGQGRFSGDGGPATKADLNPEGLAFGPDGSLYVATGLAFRVRRIYPDGIIRTVAGTGGECTTPPGTCGDGGPATQARLGTPWGIAVGPDGAFYFSEGSRAVVHKVSPDGIIHHFAGTGVIGYSGDGGLATLAKTGLIPNLAVGPDGSIYLNDETNRRIRRVDLDGIISTVAGTGLSGFSGDGGPATLAKLNSIRGMCISPDGTLYLSDAGADRIRRVTPDGIIHTIAGTGVLGFSGDGGPALEAKLRQPYGIAVGRDDSIYIDDWGNNRLRWMRLGGTIQTIAGTGVAGTTGDGGLAGQARLQGIDLGLAVGQDDSIYVTTANRVRRISKDRDRFAASELAVPSEDGSEVYIFTPNGRHLRTVDALTGALRHQFAYDIAGRLSTVTDRDGNVTTIERDGQGLPMAIVGPYGQVTGLEIDPNGYLSRITDPTGASVEPSHDGGGLLTQVTWPGGQIAGYAYDALGRLESATDPTSATRTLARSGTNGDSTITVTSPLGRMTSYRVERLAGGTVRRTTTDCAGAGSQAVTGTDGHVTGTEANGTSRTLLVGPDPRWGMRSPLTASLTTATPVGLSRTTAVQRAVELASPGDLLNVRTLTETMTIDGQAWTTAYDGASRTVVTTSPAGRRGTFTLDDRGRLAEAQIGGLYPITCTYDARGRLAALAQGQGAERRLTAFEYGSAGLLTRITDPLGRTTDFEFDDVGRPIEAVLPGGRAMRFAYDPNGRLSKVTPPGRPEHAIGYTSRDEVAVYAPPPVGAEPSETIFAYDADRNPTRIAHPDGGAVDYRYEDPSCHLALVDLGSRQRTYAYDGAGRPIALGASQGISLALAYDGGLLAGATWSGAVAGSVSWAYEQGLRVSASLVNGVDPVAIAYDADGLRVQVGGLVLTRSPQSGLITATTLGAASDSVSYDGFGQPAGYAASWNGNAFYSAVYTRDLLGRITKKTETIEGNSRIVEYAYDPAGRLVEVRRDGAVSATYTYDLNGNRLSRTDSGGTIDAAYDAQDRLLRQGTTTYTHDPRGQRTGKSAGGQTTAYRYEGLGSLIGVTLPGGAQIEDLLDAEDRRVGKRVDGALVQAFLYQGRLRPIAELNGAGELVSRFVYATGGSVPDYMVKGGATYRIIADHLGSPRLVIDVATGQVAQRMDHDEFGRVTLDSAPGFQPFGFAGGLYDPQTALVHFGAREYDPETGRWTAKDPIRFAAGDGNLYAYAGGDPVDRIDPSGLCTNTVDCTCLRQPCVCAAISGAAATGGALARQGVEALEEGAEAAATIVTRTSCMTDAISEFEELPTVVDRLPTIPGIAPPVFTASADLSINLVAQTSPALEWFWRTVEATSQWRDTLSREENLEVLRQIAETAERLFGI